MIPQTNELLKQFARVGRVFSRPIIKTKYPSQLIIENEFVSSSFIKK